MSIHISPRPGYVHPFWLNQSIPIYVRAIIGINYQRNLMRKGGAKDTAPTRLTLRSTGGGYRVSITITIVTRVVNQGSFPSMEK